MRTNEKKNKSGKTSNMLMNIFDTLFIMILCFGTLLTAMLMKEKSTGVMDYTINIKTFALTIGGLVLYMSFIIIQSEKSLKSMIDHIYGDKTSEKKTKEGKKRMKSNRKTA